MKKILLTLIATSLMVAVKAQNLCYSLNKDVQLLDVTTIDVSMAKTASQQILIPFKVIDIPAGTTININTSANDDEGTATLDTDYSYKNGDIGKLTLSATNTFTVEIDKAPIKKTNAVFSIKLTDGAKLNKTYKIIVNFNSDDEKVTTLGSDAFLNKHTVPDTADWSVTLVTGGNFDFFNGPSIKNFAGDLSAFIPDMLHIGTFKFGVDFGINNYHYFNNDSSNTKTYNQAYFLHSKDFYNSNDSSKVVAGSQAVNGKYTYNVWGIHVDPIWTIQRNDFASYYIKLHFEELATTVTYTPILSNPVNDTILLRQYNNTFKTATPPTAHVTPYDVYNQKTYYDYYMGFGTPFSIKIKNIAMLSMSPSLGLAMIHLADPAFADDPIHRDVLQPGARSKTETKFYTLNKFQMITTFAAVNIAIGGEYRTVAGNMHYFATYIGATITIDKLKR